MPSLPAGRTITNVSADVLNAIRNEASTNYKNYVPVATQDADTIRTIGAVLMDNTPLMNEFLNALVNRIAKVIITTRLYDNPLAPLKKGFLDYGETVEDIFISMADPYEFDPDNAETTLYKRYLPDVKSAFYHVNFRKFYPVTIQDEDLRRAFLSPQAVQDFISKIVEQVYTGMNYDEFQTIKYMLARTIYYGQVNTYTPSFTSAAFDNNVGKYLAAQIRALSNKFEFMSDEWNIAGVRNYSDKSKQYLIVSGDVDATLDVAALAYAFNLDKAEVQSKKIVIDGFGSLDIARLNALYADQPGYHEFSAAEMEALQAIPAMLIDENFVMLFDVAQVMKDAINGKGLYTNYFLHSWKTFAISPFANAAIIGNPNTKPSITSVTATASPTSIKIGATSVITPVVTTANFAPQKVNYTVTSGDSYVTVSAAGVVTGVAAGQATIKVTSAYDSTKSANVTVTVTA